MSRHLRSRILDVFQMTLAICSLISFFSVLIPPDIFWFAGMISYSIPGFIILNILALPVFVLIKPKRALYPLACLLISTPFIMRTYRFGEEGKPSNYDFSLYSYNVKLFREAKIYNKFSGDLIDLVENDSADIKCIQEYSTNSRWAVLDVTNRISEKGYDSYVYNAELKGSDHNPGLAIFSKNKIINSGIVWRDSLQVNATIFADIKIKNDTIRVYNVHLASMNLQLYKFKKSGNYLTKTKYLLNRLKIGGIKRTKQTKKIIDHISSCPYPFVIAGDFNETPYGFNYNKLNGLYTNSFEEAGKGFGFTLNSILFFLRIDHQFASQDIMARDFHVEKESKISDHFPTRSFYKIDRK